jgi:hypothetical protein
VTTPGRQRSNSWVRRIHALFGVVSACNLLLLIGTGLLLQHAQLLHLDEHTVTRKVLPAAYRPQDGDSGVRADIVITDLHSGRIFGLVGTLVLDVVTLAWLVMLLTGLVMYTMKRGRDSRAPNDRGSGEERMNDRHDTEEVAEEVRR